MRILFVLFDLLVPILILLIVFFAYKSLTRKNTSKAYQSWYKNLQVKTQNRHSIAFSQYLTDWQSFMDLFSRSVPTTSYHNLRVIQETLESLQAKSQVENFDSKNKPQQILMISDIVYKHAPELISEFVQLPKSLVDRKNEQGKSPIDLINENTTILATSCKEIAETLFDKNLQKLRVQQAYLNNKFSEHSNEMES
jgi:hypothetical protein